MVDSHPGRAAGGEHERLSRREPGPPHGAGSRVEDGAPAAKEEMTGLVQRTVGVEMVTAGVYKLTAGLIPAGLAAAGDRAFSSPGDPMRVPNLTPFLFGTKVTSLSPPRPHMTVVVRAAYVLSPTEAAAPPGGRISPLARPPHGRRVRPRRRGADRAAPLRRATSPTSSRAPIRRCVARATRRTAAASPSVPCASGGELLEYVCHRRVGPRRYLAEGRQETTEPEGFRARMSLGYENAYGGARGTRRTPWERDI